MKNRRAPRKVSRYAYDDVDRCIAGRCVGWNRPLLSEFMAGATSVIEMAS
jgi:hypothetical protein